MNSRISVCAITFATPEDLPVTKEFWAEPPGLLRGNCDLFVQGTLHRVPGQDRAFDAAGVFPDAGEYGKLAQMGAGLLVGCAFFGDKRPEFLK